MQNEMKPKFTQKHYEAVASVIKKDDNFVYTSILTLSKMFKTDNPKFDARRFFIACGFKDNDSEDESLEAMMDDFLAD